MKKRILGICLAIILGVLSVQSAAADSITNKETVFFPETKFSLSNPFLSEFLRLGGIPALGYPISRPFENEGFLYQAFQRGILQWNPSESRACLINLMDELSGKGFDDYLLLQGIPRHFSGDDESRGDFEKAKQIRFGWLARVEIREFYFKNPDPITFFGLPTSQPERYGPFVTQRFQRGTLQLWIENVPGMPPKGTIVGVLSGDFARKAGFIPRQALQEEVPSGKTESKLPGLFSNGDRNLPKVALTIDDAFSPALVSKALQIARKYGVKMTFFPIGRIVSSQADLWKQAIAEGHEIGNHTFSHRILTPLSSEEIKKDIENANAVLDGALGFHYSMRFLRLPGGAGGYSGGDPRLLKIAQGEGFSIAMWSVDPKNSSSTYDYVVSRVQNGDIVLLHFIEKDINVLDKIIENLQKRGFVLTTISGLFGD